MQEILLLDDALSAVDGQTEYQILQNLAQWRKETIIISAHRLSALVDATNILVLKQRRNHRTRYSSNTYCELPGWYQDMYHYQQLEAALDDDK